MLLKGIIIILLTSSVFCQFVTKDPSCPDTGVSYIPHYSNCSLFYECRDGIKYLMDCPEEYAWDADAEECRDASLVDCYYTTLSPTTPGTICPDEGVYYYPHLSDCHLYFECNEGNITLNECDVGFAWSIELDACDFEDLVNCSYTTVTSTTTYLTSPTIWGDCPESGITFIPNLGDCTAFYQCDNGEKIPDKCPDGYAWSITAESCDLEENVDCSYTTLQPTTPSSVCPSTGLDYLPDYTDCSKYYECNDGNKTLMECPDGYAWSIEENACLVKELVDCSYTIVTPPWNTETPSTTQSPTEPQTTTENTTEPQTTTGSPTEPPTTTGSPTEPQTTTELTTEPLTTTGSPTEPPTTTKLTTESPTTPESTTEPPTTTALTTEPPTTTKSTTEPPSTTGSPTEPPTTTESTTEPPTTTESTTEAPTTTALTTEPPTTTKSTTEPPFTTEFQTTTETPVPTTTQITTEAPTTPAFDICPATGFSYLPYYADCHYYYECNNGNRTRHMCPDSEAWNIIINACDKPENVDCSYTTTAATTTVEVPVCPSTGTHYFPYPYDCSYFYECNNGELVVMPCPEGYLWDADAGGCRLAETVDCNYLEVYDYDYWRRKMYL